jgi:hypothetical protein
MMMRDIQVDNDYFKRVILVCDSILEYRKVRGIRYPCSLILFSIFFGGVCAKI